ncbi:MAG: cardiolipin synthase [Erysipelotrichaceae bacterium]|nr:cardiolipin synthase [Erysipelotrichaceae bacterium]
MHKLKIFFNRFVIISLMILLELYILVLTLTYFNTYYNWVRILGVILSIAVFFHIINRKQIPEFKLPWLFLMIVFPLLGTILYVMFSSNRMTKKQNACFGEIEEEFKKLANISNQNIEKELKEYRGIDQYLKNTAHTQGHLYNKSKFYRVGEEYYEDLLIELKKAQKFIFMEYFIVEEGKMWNQIYQILVDKVQEGVEVRFLYDDLGCIGKLKGKFYKKMREKGINCCRFNPFKPILSGIHNNRDHRKITVIDGKVAFTGGINLADEYINEKELYGHWKDTGLKIEGSAVTNFTMMFLQMFDVNRLVKSDYKKYLDVKTPKFENESGCVHPFGCGPAFFYKEQVGENNYLNIINNAKKYLYITTPYLIIDYNISIALKNAAYRGVDVRIVTPSVPDKKIIFNMTRSNYKHLLEAGVKIYEYQPGFIHAKQLICDDNLAFVGTINLDYRSLVHHYECGVMLYNTNSIKEIKDDFNFLFRTSHLKTEENFKMGRFAQFINNILSLFSSMF